MTIALTREVPDAIVRCELTHLAREPIDVERARDEHAAYERILRDLGVQVVHLPPTPDLPDSVFVEDTAIVLDEIALITRPGAPSRRRELPSVEAALREYRPLMRLAEPGTLDGGDVLVLDREIVVGLTARTNEEGAQQLQAHVAPHGYTVRSVAVTGCLHLKSAVTRVGARALLINPAWVPRAEFSGWDIIEVDPTEPFAANALLIDGTVVYANEFPNTRRRLEAAGVDVTTVPAGELAKAEGGVTCCCLLVRPCR